MEIFKSTNWVGQKSLTVDKCAKTGASGETVMLHLRSGPISFCEHFTPAQAIDLAAALVDFATEIQDAETTEGAAA